jgi:hypothetical protein
MSYHTITARCDRCGTTIALNPIQLTTHPLCIPAGHAWGTFVRAHMRCGNSETTQVAPNAPTPALVRPDVISATQPLLPGGTEQSPSANLRVVGPKSGGQPSPMVTNHSQPIATYAPPNIVTHAPSPSAAGPAGGQQSGMVKQTATIIMPDGSQYDATQGQPAPSSTPLGTPGVQPPPPANGNRIVGPYEWGPLEGAELRNPTEDGVFTLTIDSTLMIERTTPAVTEALTNDRPLQCGPDPKRYMLQFTPGKASLRAPGAKTLSIVGRRLLKYNGQPWVDLPPPPAAPSPPATPSTLLAKPADEPADEPAEPAEPAEPPPIPELEAPVAREPEPPSEPQNETELEAPRERETQPPPAAEAAT